MKSNVSPHHFAELIKKSISLDHIYLLKLIEQQFDIQPLMKESMKIDALYHGLIRKGFITEDDKLTTVGIEMLRFSESKKETKLVKRKPATQEFEQWWKAYPGTDTFTHKGKTFKGSRTLRAAKDDCRIKFDKILLEGEYSAQKLTDALKYDVFLKKEASVSNNANKLTYMQNSLTYLNQRSYEAVIELLDNNIDIEKKPKGTTDI